MLQPYLLIGEVLRPQGVHGEAKVRPYAADPDDFLRWKTLYYLTDGEYVPVGARCSRVHDGFAYITLEGCASPDDVEKLRGRRLYIDRAHTAPLAKGETLIVDLIGCVAVDEKGTEVGTLTDVLQYGTVDVYVFRTAHGTLMAPALKAVFPEVDPEAGRISVIADRLEEVAVRED